MASGPAATPIFGDAYIADTAHLSTEEHGAYFLMLLAAWRRPNCDLPDDEKVLSRITRLSVKKWRSIAPTVLEFWTREDGLIWQKRLRKEHLWVSNRAAVNRSAANARWGKQVIENKGSDECERISDRICEEVCETDAPPPPPIKKKKISKSVANATQPKTAFALPDGIPRDAWDGYEEMRKRKRAPMTDRARDGVVKKLAALAEAGHPPGDVLDQSTNNSWTDVYEIKDSRNGTIQGHRGQNGNRGQGVNERAVRGFLADFGETLDGPDAGGQAAVRGGHGALPDLGGGNRDGRSDPQGMAPRRLHRP